MRSSAVRAGFSWGLSSGCEDDCLPPASSSRLLSLPLSSYKDSSQIGWGPTLITYLSLISFKKNPISKYSIIMRYWGLEHEHQTLGGCISACYTHTESHGHSLPCQHSQPLHQTCPWLPTPADNFLTLLGLWLPLWAGPTLLGLCVLHEAPHPHRGLSSPPELR